MDKEILVVKKERYDDKLRIKITDSKRNVGLNAHDPFMKYEKIIPNKDYNFLAELFFDLRRMGYNVEKAYAKFRDFINEPELFFAR